MQQRVTARWTPVADRATVANPSDRAQDYDDLWLGHAPGAAKVEAVFTAGPPGCDPARSHHPGLYLDGSLCGVAELSFGFPQSEDAYLALIILAPDARAQGHGAAFYAHVKALVRARGGPRLYLAVLEKNPRGAAAWQRQGFVPKSFFRDDPDSGHRIFRLVKAL